MGANTLIPSPTKIAVITKDLIAKGIILLFKVIVKEPTTSFPLCSSVDMVNSQKLRDGLTTASTDIAPIGIKSIIPIFLAGISRRLQTFFMVFLVVPISVFFTLIRICKTVFKLCCFSLFRVLPISFICLKTLVTLFIIYVTALLARRIITIGFSSVQRKLRNGFNYKAFATFLFHDSIIAYTERRCQN